MWDFWKLCLLPKTLDLTSSRTQSIFHLSRSIKSNTVPCFCCNPHILMSLKQDENDNMSLFILPFFTTMLLLSVGFYAICLFLFHYSLFFPFSIFLIIEYMLKQCFNISFCETANFITRYRTITQTNLSQMKILDCLRILGPNTKPN